ncbi:CDC27 family protein [Shouchella lonarensis]|uniref:Anaphase-promoting complex, cyclosome, subunit 3 n=1 Tax=Shouchella lonarensis TaxID=1464122 RepID=A0A1G6HAB8_9BACI|nr:tetratricopeptide repeat protein [Shouchella lonarensis]SDB91161.1 Anaphase-promoting complex, cyclosome, subunit 3 [Shouchella lonarensis]
MHQFISQWQTLYEHARTTPIAGDHPYVKTLEHMTQQLLNLWGTMDEQLQALKHELANRRAFLAYETKGTELFAADCFEQALEQLQTEEACGEADCVRRLYVGYAALYTEKNECARDHFAYVLQVAVTPLLTHFAYFGLGLLAMVRHDWEQAIIHFERAESLTSNTDVVYNLGVCYYLLGAYESAACYFHTYVNRHEDCDVYVLWGLSLMKAGRVEEGKKVWLASAALTDSDALLARLAESAEWFGVHDLACHCYEQLMQINGETIPLLHGFAWNKALSGDEEGLLLLATLGQADAEAHRSWCLLHEATK